MALHRMNGAFGNRVCPELHPSKMVPQPSVVQEDKPAKKCFASDLLPTALLFFLRYIGLFPYSIADGSLAFSWRVALWSGIRFVLAVTFAVGYAYDYSVQYGTKIEDLEFYVLVAGIFRNTTLLMGGVVWAIVATKWNQIASFLCYWDASIAITLEGRETRTRQIFLVGYGGVGWNVATLGVVIFSVYWTWGSYLCADPFSGWSDMVWLFFGSTRTPVWCHALYLSVGKSLCALITNGPQTLIVVCTFGIGLMFKTVGEILRKVSSDTAAALLRTTLTAYRRTMHLLAVLNETFSLVILVTCFQDAVVSVAFLANVLEDPSTLDKTMVWYTFSFTMIAFVNATMRTGVSLFCCEQAKSVRLATQKIRVDFGNDEAVMDVSSELLDEMGRETPALSCGGCFWITREYVIACFACTNGVLPSSLSGKAEMMMNSPFRSNLRFLQEIFSLLTTYFLLIYQTRDQKNDDKKLMSALVNSSAEIKEAIALMQQNFHVLSFHYRNLSIS